MTTPAKPSRVCGLPELSPEIQALCRASVEARNFSYSPYSKFKVGAALVTNLILAKIAKEDLGVYPNFLVRL